MIDLHDRFTLLDLGTLQTFTAHTGLLTSADGARIRGILTCWLGTFFTTLWKCLETTGLTDLDKHLGGFFLHTEEYLTFLLILEVNAIEEDSDGNSLS